MNLKKSLSKLEDYFSQETNAPEIIQSSVRRAALLIATRCAHPQDLETQDLEQIATALEYLSEIMDIVDMYEADNDSDIIDKV